MSEDLTRLLDSVMSLAGQVRELRDTEQFIGNDVIAPAYAAPEGTPHFDTNLRNLWVNYDGTAPGWQLIGGGGGPAVHNILSASHGDAAVQAVSRGSLIYGDATPVWNELVHPAAANRILTTNANDVLWSTWALVGTAAQTYTFPTVGGTVTLGTGTAGQVTYWGAGVPSQVTGDAGFTYDSANDIVTITPAVLGGLTFAGAATGRNRVQVPDNFANALYLDDAGGIEYLKFVSTNAQPVTVFNDGMADVDLRVESSSLNELLFCDAGLNAVGIGRVPTVQRLDVEVQARVVRGANEAAFLISTYSATDAHNANCLLRKSASSTIDTLSNISASENIGTVIFQGVVSGAWSNFGYVSCANDAVSGNGVLELWARRAAGSHPTMSLHGNGRYTAIYDKLNVGTVAQPATTLELVEVETLSGNLADGYSASETIDPGYTGGFTVTRHNYIDVNDVSLAGGAALTDGAVFRFDAAAGTHKAVDAATTKTTPGAVDAWVKININGTIYYMPAYTSKTA